MGMGVPLEAQLRKELASVHHFATIALCLAFAQLALFCIREVKDIITNLPKRLSR